MERIWNYVYREGLGTASEEVSLIILTSELEER